MRSEDIQTVAAIHQRALPDDFLPSLGSSFLEKVFYPAVLESTHATGLVATAGSKLLGFAIVATHSQKLIQDVVRHKPPRFTKELTRYITKSPHHLIQTLALGRVSQENLPAGKVAEIYLIAVDPCQQGKGTGNMLVAASVQLAKDHALDGICIKTLKTNTRWVAYFQNKNWKKIKELKIQQKEYVYLLKSFHRISIGKFLKNILSEIESG